MSISSYGLKHPAVIAVVAAGLVLFGILALSSLNREFVPEMNMPELTVVSIWPGAGPADVEREVTDILEDRFSTLSGLREIRSVSAEGYGIIRMEFQEDQEPDKMLPEVRDRIRQAADDLPPDLATEPRAYVYGVENTTVVSFAVSGAVDLDRLTRYVDETVIPEVFRVDGVSQVEMVGERERQLIIRIDPEALAGTGTGPLEIYGALAAQNLSLPAGTVSGGSGEWSFRVAGEFDNLREVENLVVGAADGYPLRLTDVASVAFSYGEADEYIRSDGDDLVVVEVKKRLDGNILDISKDIRGRLVSLEKESDGLYRFNLLADDRDLVRFSLRAVLSSALTGILMAVGVIWLFLRDWRATAVAAISLPISLVVAFAGMRLAGQTINILTLTGITVSLGMVVDASIVVLENIYRQSALGREPGDAAEKGAGEVSGAVLASTTTSISVFAPMIFLTGIIGAVMKDLSLTLVLCLGASLLAAVFLVPGLAYRILRRRVLVGKPRKRTVMPRMEEGYAKSLKRVLKMPWTVVIASVGILAISVLGAGLLGLSFVPASDAGDFSIYLETPPGSTLDETAAKAGRAEEILRQTVPEIVTAVFFVGHEDEYAGDGRRRDAAYGRVILTPREKRDRDVLIIIEEVRNQLSAGLPDVSVVVLNGGFDRMVAMSAGGSGFRVELSGRDIDELQKAGDLVAGWMAEDPEVYKTERDMRLDRREVTVDLDADVLGQVGLTAREIATAVRILFEGVDAGEFRPPGGPDTEIRLVSTLEGSEASPESLGSVSLPTPSGSEVPLDSLVTTELRPGISEIRRHDRVRTLTVTGYTVTENTRGISGRLRQKLTGAALPAGVEWRFEGLFGLIADSALKLLTVLIVALFLVYAVMVIQFERFLQPLIIMASVPFCFIGVVGGLAAFGSDFSVVSFLGIVALGGIVVNNAIVLVDRINRLRRDDGMDLDQAVIAGARSRLRPILMTSLTTFFGVLPLALTRGTGARIYAPLGQAIAGGLATSTLITLFLIPVLYRLAESRRQRQIDVETEIQEGEGAA